MKQKITLKARKGMFLPVIQENKLCMNFVTNHDLLFKLIDFFFCGFVNM
jgi:hypothetical protein